MPRCSASATTFGSPSPWKNWSAPSNESSASRAAAATSTTISELTSFQISSAWSCSHTGSRNLVSQLSQARRQCNERKAGDRRLIVRFDRLEQHDTMLFQLVAAGAIEGQVTLHVSLDLGSGERAHFQPGDIRVSNAPAATNHHQGSDQLMRSRRQDGELFLSQRRGSRFAEDLFIDRGKLVASNDRGPRFECGDAGGLSLGQHFRDLSRRLTL